MNENMRGKERGQSLVLVAGALVVLVMFVAIAVDLGGAYYARRTAQNGADGAALAGASRLSAGINEKKNPNLSQLDHDVQVEMNDFAERNGIEDTDPSQDATNGNVEGWYVDTDGNRIVVDGVEVKVGSGKVPEGAAGVEAITHILAPAFFGGVFGADGYQIQARAVSLIRLACGSDCVVPLTTDVDFILDPDGEPRAACYHIWQERVKNAEDISSGALGWVNWTWQASMCDGSYADACGLDARPCPIVPQGTNGCQEGVLEGNLNASISCANGFVEVGDWMSAATGDMNSGDVRCWLSYYAGYDDPSLADVCTDGVPHSFTVPVYDLSTADMAGGSSTPCLRMTDPCDYTTGGLHYRIAGFAQVQLLQFQLSNGQEIPPDDALDLETLARIDSCVDYYDFACDPQLDPDCNIEELKHEGFRMTVDFIQYVQDATTSNECYDPLGTLWSSPKLTE